MDEIVAARTAKERHGEVQQMPIRTREPGLALLVCAAVALIGSAASAQGVVDNDFDITDANDSTATGRVEASGSLFNSHAVVRCTPASTTNGPDGTNVGILTDHPDAVKIRGSKASVGQSAKGNLPLVAFVTGGGTGTITAILTCDRARVAASVDEAKMVGQFKGEAKNCTCVVGSPASNSLAACNAHAARLPQSVIDCADRKSIKLKVDGNTIKSIAIRGKGGV